MSDSSIAKWIHNDSTGNGTGIHHGTNFLNHRAFFWGHNVEILFKGWPGNDAGMYALSIIFIFVLALIVECFTYTVFAKPGSSKLAAGFFKTGLYAVRAGLNYMVVLAVMSYNGGIFLAAVGGHAVGYLIFGSRICRRSTGGSSPSKKPDDLPSL